MRTHFQGENFKERGVPDQGQHVPHGKDTREEIIGREKEIAGPGLRLDKKKIEKIIDPKKHHKCCDGTPETPDVIFREKINRYVIDKTKESIDEEEDWINFKDEY